MHSRIDETKSISSSWKKKKKHWIIRDLRRDRVNSLAVGFKMEQKTNLKNDCNILYAHYKSV